MRYSVLSVLLIACLFPLGLFGQVEPKACGHTSHANSAVPAGTSNFFGGKNLQKSNLAGSDACHDNGITSSLFDAGIPKTIPLVFHFIQNAAGDRNFQDNSATQTLMEAIIDRANDKLSNNQPAFYYYGGTAPPVNEIGFRFEYKDAKFYESADWPYPESGDPQEDPDALNVVCTEHVWRWVPQPETFGLAYTTQATCGNSDGSVVLYGLTSGRQYAVNFRLNGSGTITNWGNVVANGQGMVTISGLEAGSYTDFSLQDIHGQDFLPITASISNQGMPSLEVKGVTNTTNCTANDGSIILRISSGGSGIVRLLYEQDGIPQDVNVPMTSGLISLSNLPAGYYSHLRLVGSSGCVSNDVDISIKESSAPTIVADRVTLFSPQDPVFSQFDGRSTCEVGGLTPGNSYQAWVRQNSSGAYAAYDVIEEGGKFKIDNSGSFESLTIGFDVYHEMYITDLSNCERTNTITFRPGDDFKPSGVGGSANFGASFLSMYEMYHRYQYKVGAAGSPNTGHPYSGPETYNEYVNTMCNILIHEFGHIGSLQHTFGSNGSGTPPCDDVYWTVFSCPPNQNNFMDNNCGDDKNCFVPCQIDKMHSFLEGRGWDRYYFCDNSSVNSSLAYFPDISSGNMTFLNNFSGPSSGITELYSITPQTTPASETSYANTPILFLNLMQFAGQTIEVCANTIDEDGCTGVEDCEVVTFPVYNTCRVSQVTAINIIKDKDGCPIELDPSSLSTKPHYWTVTAANGSSLSSTCVHNPDVIYSPEAEYLGDVLDVCVNVMGTQAGTPCTTEVCTTVVLPPKYDPCPGGPLQAPFFHSVRRSSGYKIDLEARSYTSDLVYEHIWLIKDNISGRESTVYGVDPTLRDKFEFDRIGRTIDLKVCHIIRNKISDCIVGGECQDVFYECASLNAFLSIISLTFDPVNQELVLVYQITQNELSHDAEIFLDNQLFTSYSNTNPQSTYTVTIPVNSCGTSLIEIKTSFTTLLSGGVLGNICSYISRTITYGPQPCIQTVPGIATGKREGLEAKGYDLQIMPNPASTGFCVLLLETAEDEHVKLDLVDIHGKTVKRFDQAITKGENEIRIDLYGLASGLYMVHVQGHIQQSTKLIIDN